MTDAEKALRDDTLFLQLKQSVIGKVADIAHTTADKVEPTADLDDLGINEAELTALAPELGKIATTYHGKAVIDQEKLTSAKRVDDLIHLAARAALLGRADIRWWVRTDLLKRTKEKPEAFNDQTRIDGYLTAPQLAALASPYTRLAQHYVSGAKITTETAKKWKTVADVIASVTGASNLTNEPEREPTA